MRTVVSSLFLLLLTCSMSIPVSAHPVNATRATFINVGDPAVFGSLHAHRQGKGVSLIWHITNPATVTGFEIERSYDGEFFDLIGSFASGNSSIERFRDLDVFPGYIHYRVKAYLEDGSVVYSDIAIVRIVQRK